MPHRLETRIARALALAALAGVTLGFAPDAGTAAVADPAPVPPDFAAVDTNEAIGPDRGAGENEFPVLLASFSTTLIGSLPARTVNVRLAAVALDGQVLRPGEALSFNRVVGPRTLERGYQPAPVILRETRQVQTGGGVCQTASTVFVAALLSGLSIGERHRHSTPIDYAPPGHDATIAWGVKDLELRNDLDQSVRLRVEIVGSALLARFEAQRPVDATYEVTTEEREIAGDPGAGSSPGREIEVFRVRHGASGDSSRDLLYRDVYPPARAGSR